MRGLHSVYITAATRVAVFTCQNTSVAVLVGSECIHCYKQVVVAIVVCVRHP